MTVVITAKGIYQLRVIAIHTHQALRGVRGVDGVGVGAGLPINSAATPPRVALRKGRASSYYRAHREGCCQLDPRWYMRIELQGMVMMMLKMGLLVDTDPAAISTPVCPMQRRPYRKWLSR